MEVVVFDNSDGFIAVLVKPFVWSVTFIETVTMITLIDGRKVRSDILISLSNMFRARFFFPLLPKVVEAI